MSRQLFHSSRLPLFVLLLLLQACKPSLKLVLVEGGSFKMGCTSEQEICGCKGVPVEDVTLPDFYIGKYEVTQRLWVKIMGSNPSSFKGCPKCPVDNVSWNDTQTFLKKLNQKYPGKNFRLPSEAEWEYAARGGRKSGVNKYAGGNQLDEVAWHYSNAGNKTHPVGQKAPNELGIYDMSGNLWEWCADTRPAAKNNSSEQDFAPQRGGSWNSPDFLCCNGFRPLGYARTMRSSNFGLRLVRTR